MNISFIKLNHSLYRLEIVKDNTTLYSKELEMKSFFRHDLMHFLVESTAGLEHSFYGDFKNGVTEDRSEIMQTERVVAVLQGIDKDPSFSPENYFKKFKMFYETQGDKIPEYLTQDFIEKVSNKYFSLLKQWEFMQTGENSKMIMEF